MNKLENFYIADGTNGNKIITSFDTEAECKKYITDLEHYDNWQGEYSTFEDYANEFSIIDAERMQKAIDLKGGGQLCYFN